jgi:hypothetical protein
LTRNIVQSYRIFWLDSPSEIKAFVEVSVVIFILIIAIKYWRREYGIFDIFFELIMITIVMFLTLAPIWIVGYNQVEIRFLAISGLFPALLIGLIFSTFVGGTIDSNLSRTRTKTLYAIFLMLAMLFSYKHYDQGLSPILINTKEFVQSELSGCSRRQIVEGVTIQTRVGAFPNRNFLGMYSQSTDLASEWVQIPAIRAFIDRDMKSIDLNEISFQMNRKSDLNRMCIIDLNRYVAPSSR